LGKEMVIEKRGMGGTSKSEKKKRKVPGKGITMRRGGRPFRAGLSKASHTE